MNIYQQQILDNYHNPYHHTRPAQFTHSLKLSNLSCGDEVEVFLDVQNGIINSIHYQAEGCAISIASASLLAQELEGKTLTEIQALTEKELMEILGIELTPTRQKCALLPLEAIQKSTSV